MMNRLQQIELEILLEVDRVCKKNNITYFLDSGTALGAVRHGGFIPWDDDIDIGMLREDYIHFLSVAKEELGSNYFLQTIDTDPGCPCLFTKVRKNGTRIVENNKNGMDMHMGIWIDIFPFDFLPDNELVAKLKLSSVSFLKTVFLVRKIPNIHPGKKSFKHVLKTVIRKIIHYFTKIISESMLVKSINTIIGFGNNDSSNVVCYFYGKPIVFDVNQILPTKIIIFENEELPIVNNTDYYLSKSYGDYMKLPPVEAQRGHSPLFVDYGEE